MNKYVIIFFSFFIFNCCNAQSLWTLNVRQDANTAEQMNYLTATEKEVIFYINLVRINPSLFEKTYLKKFLDSTLQNNSYTKSLIKLLKESSSIHVLKPSEELFKTAKQHAIKYGKAGKIGHDNFEDRMKNIKDKFSGTVAENCDYGNNEALAIVISLLIDESDKNLGHRKNILDPNYFFIGVSIQSHKEYEWNCVMDFGGRQQK